MSGRVGDLSPKQEEILRNFRDAVSDILQDHHDDYFLLRWLRARNFDKNKSEAMLRKHMEWRKEYGIDTLLTSYQLPEAFEKYFPDGFLGYDKEGCPVRVIVYGNLDFPGAVQCVRTKEIVKCIASRFETDIKLMEEQSKRLGKVIETHVYIVDVKDIPMKWIFNKAVADVVLHVSKVYQDNYPERLKKVYIINISNVFTTGFRMLKRFIDPKVLEKYCLYGADGWKEALLEDIDAEVLPAYLGGTRVDPDGDPTCPSVINQGGVIPTHYYMKNTRRDFGENNSIKKLHIDRRDYADIGVSVDKPGTTLSWHFLSIDHDVGFGLFYRIKEVKDDPEEIIPVQRLDCHLVPENGTHVCSKPGTYVLRFDNSYSYIRQKEILYHVETESPMDGGKMDLIKT